MGLIIIWLLIGVAIGAAATSFMDRRGRTLGMPLGIVWGVVGSVSGGFLFVPLAITILGDGLVEVASFLAAAIAALAAVLVARTIKR
jgi:uncharacterized membrane protein YeaQ/YmgE (transglycosylase-associated protein family)